MFSQARGPSRHLERGGAEEPTRRASRVAADLTARRRLFVAQRCPLATLSADVHHTPRAPRGRRPRVPPPRHAHARLAAAAHASFHHVALTRSSRPQPARRHALTPDALRAAAALASFHRAALTRSVRPLPSRSSTAPLPASRSTAARAFFLRASLRVLVGRVPRVLSPRRSSRPSRPLPVRSSTAPPSARCGRRRCAANSQRSISACDRAARDPRKRPRVSQPLGLQRLWRQHGPRG